MACPFSERDVFFERFFEVYNRYKSKDVPIFLNGPWIHNINALWRFRVGGTAFSWALDWVRNAQPG
jgi:hypothetical protein